MKKINNRGMTLLELIVIILSLFNIILLLFIVSDAMKEESGHFDCKMNSIYFGVELQKYQACKGVGPGDSFIPEKVLIHGGVNPEDFKCPMGGTYTFQNKIPQTGHIIFSCSLHPTSSDSPMKAEKE